MLGLLAVLGAFGAGLVADTLLRPSPGADDEEGAESEEVPGEAETEDAAPGLGWILTEDAPAEPLPAGTPSGFVDDGMPVSDDIADPVDPAVSMSGGAGDDILSGEGADDRLAGGAGDDQLTGRGGDDRMFGGAGRDHLEGGAGQDTLFGQGSADVLAGGAGADVLFGGRGADQLAGAEGDDLLFGGTGADTLLGGEGQDTLAGGQGRDWLAGGAGDDLLVGGASADTLDGGDGDDTLWGGAESVSDAGKDMLNGGAGDDHLRVGPGDIATGGAGANLFALQDFAPGLPLSDITDYDPAQDDLLVIYDPAVHPAPQLTTEAQDGSEDVTLLLDGVAIALIRDAAGLDLSLIRLQPA